MEIKIAFFDAKPYDKTFFDLTNSDFGFQINYIEAKLDSTSVVLADGADAVCAFVNDKIDKAVIEKLNEMGIKVVALRCAGFNNVDFQAAFEKIHIVRVPDYSPRAVAEFTVALLQTLNRKIHRAYNRTREGNFSLNGLIGFDLYKKTAGIIGTGKIGKALAKILTGYGMRILAYDPEPDSELKSKGIVEYVELDELFSNSNVISLNCPLNKDTHHIINAASIDKFKDGAIVLNTGRGGLIDTKALIEALKTGKIGGAALDVYEEEDQYFFEDFSHSIIEDDTLVRLLSFNNVIVTSHQGFFTEEALHNIAETTLVNLSEFFKGSFFPNEICYQCVTGEKCPKVVGEKSKCFS